MKLKKYFMHASTKYKGWGSSLCISIEPSKYYYRWICCKWTNHQFLRLQSFSSCYLTLKVVRDINANNIPIIQNLVTILLSCIPSFWKWWWSGAILNILLPFTAQCQTLLKFFYSSVSSHQSWATWKMPIWRIPTRSTQPFPIRQEDDFDLENYWYCLIFQVAWCNNQTRRLDLENDWFVDIPGCVVQRRRGHKVLAFLHGSHPTKPPNQHWSPGWVHQPSVGLVLFNFCQMQFCLKVPCWQIWSQVGRGGGQKHGRPQTDGPVGQESQNSL